MTQTLEQLAIYAVYSAIGVYVLAFIAFALDLARRAALREGEYRTGVSLRAAVGLTVVGFVLHVAAILLRGFAAGRVPWDNLFGYALISTAVVIAVFLGLLMRQDLRFVGTFVLGFTTILLGGATVLFYVPIVPLQPALQSLWLVFHVFVAALGLGFFGVGFALSVVQLLKQREQRRLAEALPAAEPSREGSRELDPSLELVGAERVVAAGGDGPAVATGSAAGGSGSGSGSGSAGGGADGGRPPASRLSRFLATFPSAESLETLAYRVNIVGFVFWTFTLIAGAIWANFAWGRFWGWDVKEVWTFIVWTVYAGYIHARATRGWRGTAAAWLAIAGFAAVVFNATVVNTLFNGLHSYSGL